MWVLSIGRTSLPDATWSSARTRGENPCCSVLFAAAFHLCWRRFEGGWRVSIPSSVQSSQSKRDWKPETWPSKTLSGESFFKVAASGTRLHATLTIAIAMKVQLNWEEEIVFFLLLVVVFLFWRRRENADRRGTPSWVFGAERRRRWETLLLPRRRQRRKSSITHENDYVLL